MILSPGQFSEHIPDREGWEGPEGNFGEPGQSIWGTMGGSVDTAAGAW